MKETSKNKTTAEDKEQSLQKQNNSADEAKKGSTTKKGQDSKKPTSEVKNSTSEVPDLQTVIYSVGDSVPSTFQDQVKIVEGLDLLISEKKDRRFFLQELTKPIPREQRKLGKRSPLTPAQKKAAKIEIKHLEKDIFNLEEDRRTAMGYLTRLVNDGKTSIDLQIVRDRSQSDHYLRRNKNHIYNNVVSLINEERSKSIRKVNPLIEASKQNGKKAVEDFQSMLINFIRVNRYELSILCSGKDSFKQQMATSIRRVLRNWDPSAGKLSL
jgi:hypothetical protein